MSEVRLVMVDKEDVLFETCGVSSIDESAKEAFAKSIFKQAVAYNILVDGTPAGGCMLCIGSIRNQDDDFYVGDTVFPVVKISYIAVDRKLQGFGIGSRVLNMLIRDIKELSERWPIRYIILDSLPERKDWYKKFGFAIDTNLESKEKFAVPMKMDLMDREIAEAYTGQF